MASKRQVERMTPMSEMHDVFSCPVCQKSIRRARPESSFVVAFAMIVCAITIASIWLACITLGPLVVRWISEVGR